MTNAIQATAAIDAAITAISAPRKRQPADSVRLAQLKAVHDLYLAHVRAVVADFADDKAAAALNTYADSIDDAHHDWFRDAVTHAERSEDYRWWEDADAIRDIRAV